MSTVWTGGQVTVGAGAQATVTGGQQALVLAGGVHGGVSHAVSAFGAGVGQQPMVPLGQVGGVGQGAGAAATVGHGGAQVTAGTQATSQQAAFRPALHWAISPV
jgi:hypothetical protein